MDSRGDPERHDVVAAEAPLPAPVLAGVGRRFRSSQATRAARTRPIDPSPSTRPIARSAQTRERRRHDHRDEVRVVPATPRASRPPRRRRWPCAPRSARACRPRAPRSRSGRAGTARSRSRIASMSGSSIELAPSGGPRAGCPSPPRPAATTSSVWLATATSSTPSIARNRGTCSDATILPPPRSRSADPVTPPPQATSPSGRATRAVQSRPAECRQTVRWRRLRGGADGSALPVGCGRRGVRRQATRA